MIRIFTTGGTIDKVYFDDNSEFQVGEPQVLEILEQANLAVDYRVTSLLKKDSLHFTAEDRRLIRDAVGGCTERRVIITHGTDTMVETGRLLQAVPGKVIVMTGAMQPARFRHTDATFNIAAAFMAVQLLGEGTHIVMNGRVLKPDGAVKNRERHRFESNDR